MCIRRRRVGCAYVGGGSDVHTYVGGGSDVHTYVGGGGPDVHTYAVVCTYVFTYVVQVTL